MLPSRYQNRSAEVKPVWAGAPAIGAGWTARGSYCCGTRGRASGGVHCLGTWDCSADWSAGAHGSGPCGSGASGWSPRGPRLRVLLLRGLLLLLGGGEAGFRRLRFGHCDLPYVR